MAKRVNLVGTHIDPRAAAAIVGMNSYTENNGAAITAAGTTITDALQLSADVNNVAGASNAGVKLDPNASPSDLCVVYVSGSNTIKAYPATASGTINGGSAGASVSIPTLKMGIFINVGGGDNWGYLVTA